MRDAGLEQAIKAAGGITALARALSVAQPSISNWSRVPAERVLAVETLTSVPRAILRPDLYPAGGAVPSDDDAVEEMRGRLYLLLSNLLFRVPQDATIAELARLTVSGDGEVSVALAALSDAAKSTSGIEAQREHFDLFVGVGRGELMPYASYYLTGFLYERPLVRVRQDLKVLGLARGDAVSDPEDGIGFLCEVMAGLVLGEFAAPEGFERAFFERHIAPWAEQLFKDVEKAEGARFYRAVGLLGRVFIALEREAFSLEASSETADANRRQDSLEDSHERKAS